MDFNDAQIRKEQERLEKKRNNPRYTARDLAFSEPDENVNKPAEHFNATEQEIWMYGTVGEEMKEFNKYLKGDDLKDMEAMWKFDSGFSIAKGIM